MAETTNSPFLTTVSQKVLELETNDGRFETFCRAVISSLEGGAPVLSTSTSWDLGRDGVGVGVARGIYVCCSLRDDPDFKALTDIQRLVETTKDIQRLYFCSSQPLSEHRCSTIEQQLQSETDYKFPVKCLGSSQLSELGQRIQGLYPQHYGAEIRDCLRAIKADEDDDVTEIKGLRLALMASAADDTQSIRHEVYCAGLLDVLSDGREKTTVACANELSAKLKLGRNIATQAIQPYLSALDDDGFLVGGGPLYRITQKGTERMQELELAAANRLLVGRREIRESLETAMSVKFPEDQFARIWSVFEERMAQYFLARGDAIVAEISDILEDGPHEVKAGKNERATYSFLESLAEAVAATSSHTQQRMELQQAIKDLFADRTSVATNWLVRLCTSYVEACALGLEHSSGVALSKLLARTTIVLDTDVTLSLLGHGEPEHEAANTVVTKWVANSGKVLVGEPVLEEVAYHAFIAEADFQQVRHMLPGTPEDRLHIIENAFVRSFAELVANKKAKLGHWARFISQFKGGHPRDWQPTFGFLTTEYSIGKLPQRSTSEARLEEDVRQYLTAQAEIKGHTSFNAKDKARRDAQLYSALVHRVKVVRAGDPGATCLLVSSAHRLASAEARFQESGEPQMVISISTALFLLARLPNVSLGLSAMKAFLFDERRFGITSELERTLLRMVRSSQEVFMPFAKRGLLMRTVRNNMIKDARERGLRRPNKADLEQIEQHALKPENQSRTIEILRDSLDEIAVDTRAERENAKLREEVKALKAQLQREKGRRK